MADGSLPSVERTALYRHFDADGKLLYVGISLSPIYRLSQHGDGSAWFSRIADVRIQWFDTRKQAMDAEKAAIKAEDPEFNIVHKLSAKEEYLAEMAEESCAELTRKVTRFNPSYTVNRAAEVIGICSGDLRLALQAGDLPFYPSGKNILISGWAVIAYIEALQAGALKVRKRVRNPDGSYPPYPSSESIVLALDT